MRGYDDARGAVAEWLGRGLQSLVQRFDSARRLCYVSMGGSAASSQGTSSRRNAGSTVCGSGDSR
jgi:hypothetical protein